MSRRIVRAVIAVVAAGALAVGGAAVGMHYHAHHPVHVADSDMHYHA